MPRSPGSKRRSAGARHGGCETGIRGVEWTIGNRVIEFIEADAAVTLLDHTHELPHLLIMIRGTLHEGGRELRAGDLRLSPPRDRHFVRFGEPSRCVLIHLDHFVPPEERIYGRFDATPLRAAQAMRSVRTAAQSAEVQEFLDRAVGCARRQAVERRATKVPAWLREVHRYVSGCPADIRRVRVLARRAGVSREHLTRAFRHHYGAPLSRFLRIVRLVHAYDRLAQSRDPLAEVAAACGFSDQSHMTRKVTSVQDRPTASMPCWPAWRT
jgi:AraC family transcriptional regulator